jgi:hypothetical protein
MDNEQPMKNWVHIPFIYKDLWTEYTLKAFEFVQTETEK